MQSRNCDVLFSQGYVCISQPVEVSSRDILMICQAGKKAFCAGMDLKQRLDIINTNGVALAYAQEIAEKSPDSVIISRLAAREVWETGVSRATIRGQELYGEAMIRSKNTAEGLAAYREKRDPKWLPSYL